MSEEADLPLRSIVAEPQRPSSAGNDIPLYSNRLVALVSWVNLADSDNNSSSAPSSLMSLSAPSPSSLCEAPNWSPEQAETKAGSAVTATATAKYSAYPEYAYVEDKTSGKKVLYRRVNTPSDILLECVHFDEPDRLRIAVFIASNVVIFTLGYIVNATNR